MRVLLIILATFFGFAGLAGAETPPEDFLRQQLVVPFNEVTRATVGSFLANMPEGEWEPDENNSWVYRISTVDKLTGQSKEIALMLVPQPFGVLLSRAAVNGQEIPTGQIMLVFLEVLKKAISEPQQKGSTNLQVGAPENQVSTQHGLLKITENGEVWVGGKVLVKDDSSGQWAPNISWTYPKIGPAFLVAIFFNTGGTACPGLFRIVDLSGPVVRSTEPFGTCSDLADFQYFNGDLQVSMPRYNDGQAGKWSYRDGQLVKKN